ncbi:MAG: hypothetical protein FJ280_27725 [Planctomycetes bacterium]|nr:hypothetical protein [Planctomycetota bacterium]
MSEEEKVREIFDRAARGESIGNQLVYHRPSRSFRPAQSCNDPDRAMKLTNQDGHLWAGRKGGNS